MRTWGLAVEGNFVIVCMMSDCCIRNRQVTLITLRVDEAYSACGKADSYLCIRKFESSKRHALFEK